MSIDLYDIDLEKSALMAVLNNPKKADMFFDKTTPDFFGHPKLQRLYKCAENAYQEKGVLNYSDFYQRLKKEFGDDATKAVEYLGEGIVLPSELDGLLGELEKYSVKRRILDTSSELARIAKEDLTPEQYFAKAEELIFRQGGDYDKAQGLYTGEEASSKWLEEFLAKQSGERELNLKTGFPTLDAITDGLKNSHLYILAGSTSMGKTAFMVSMLNNILQRGKKVFVISLEMTATEIVERLVGINSRVPPTKYNEKLTEAENLSVQHAVDKTYNQSWGISDQRGLSSTDIKSQCRRVAKSMFDGHIDLVLIDYMSLLSVPGGRDNYAYRLGKEVTELRNFARELDCPIVLAAQIDRQVAKHRANKRPLLQDLKDTGVSENVADSVWFVHSDYYYDPELISHKVWDAELIVRKNRTGATGIAPFRFYRPITYWQDGVEAPLESQHGINFEEV